MKIFESKFERDGNSFFVQGWEPDAQPKAILALVHGLGEHVGRYIHVAQAFTDAGYALIGFDLRGHGRSEGLRGHTPTFEALMDDIGRLLEAVVSQRTSVAFLWYNVIGAVTVFVVGLLVTRVAPGPAARPREGGGPAPA